MKYLSIFIFIPLFLFAGEEKRPLKPSDTLPVNSENPSQQVYGKSTLYSYLLEPFISLDEKLDSIVTHCSIVSENLSQTIQTYDGLGSCLFEQVDAFSDKKRTAKNIIIHTTLEDQSFDLLFQWEGLSLQDVLASYIDKNPQKLSTQITLTLINSEMSLADSMSYFILSALSAAHSSKEEPLIQQASSLLSNKKVNAIHLTITPYKKELIKAALSFADSMDVEFYNLEVITNYYAGADKYFVTSIDQYQDESHEE